MFSGSFPQVLSMEIASPPSSSTVPFSLKVDNGLVEFNTILQVPSSGVVDLTEGTVVKTVSDSFLAVRNATEPQGVSKILIPFNNAYLDTNHDGEIGSADLLEFLIAYGDNVENLQTNDHDATGDGEIGSADLLQFLIAFGALVDDLIDTRPSINWVDPSYNWLDNTGVATSASVSARYDAIAAANGGNDANFWSMLPSGGTISEAFNLPTDNVKAYVEKTSGITTATIELFTYIYFTQSNTGDFGGSTYYSTSSYSGVYPPL